MTAQVARLVSPVPGGSSMLSFVVPAFLSKSMFSAGNPLHRIWVAGSGSSSWTPESALCGCSRGDLVVPSGFGLASPPELSPTGVQTATSGVETRASMPKVLAVIAGVDILYYFWC